MNSEELAKNALSNNCLFCNLLADARRYEFPGWWHGSAYCSHPVGVIEGTIKLTNYWTVGDSCSIHITDGDGWNRNVAMNPRYDGNPHPQPINGSSIEVWRSGEWVNETFTAKLEQRVLDILTRLAEHVKTAKQREEEERAAARRADECERARIVEAAIAKALA